MDRKTARAIVIRIEAFRDSAREMKLKIQDPFTTRDSHASYFFYVGMIEACDRLIGSICKDYEDLLGEAFLDGANK